MARLVPFSNNVLCDVNDDAENEASLKDQFPASFRRVDDLLAPTDSPDFELIVDELDPKRLHEIVHHLWLAGRPVPPRALHHQVLMDRDIILSERIELHLVWGGGIMYIKPIPRFLLNPLFWSTHLACPCVSANNSSSNSNTTSSCKQSQTCQRRHHLRQCAFGFLLSYVALIARESDFAIAKAKNLIPEEVNWQRWRRFVRELLHGHDGANLTPEQLYADVAPRFIYGELRINRLRLIDKVLHGPLASAFMSNWTSYGSLARDNSASIIAATAWILLILSSMQVGLGTDRLAGSAVFQDISWGFTLFSIIAPLGAVFALLVLFAILIMYNLVRTRVGEAKRSKMLGRNWRKKEHDTKSSDARTMVLGENSKESSSTV